MIVPPRLGATAKVKGAPIPVAAIPVVATAVISRNSLYGKPSSFLLISDLP